MNTKLPNAPLTEVVFEMQWGILDYPPIPLDPGYPFIVDAFTTFANKLGFSKIQELHPGYAGFGRSVSRRFYRAEGDFPLLQLGPGLFAANDSVEYDWQSFKKMANKAASTVVANYPTLADFSLDITQLEIRYLDTFEKSLLGSADFLEFINSGTEIRLSLPSLWNSKLIGPEKRARLAIEAEVRKLAGAIFSIDIASAQHKDVPVIRMETKVVSKGQKLLPTKLNERFSQKLDEWLDRAHELTSSSFKEVINSEIFEKFK